jgi:hypothetical protein
MAAERVALERRVADRVFGALGVALVLAGLVYFALSFREGGSDTGSGAAAAIPTLSVLSPAAGAELAQPAAVEFDAGAPLVPGPTGWTADGRHLHLFAGGTELMAASGELRHLGGTRYRWTLPRLPAGETTLRLAWSDESHRTIPQGASPAVPVRLR